MSLGTRSRLDEQFGMSLSPGPAFVVACQEKKKKGEDSMAQHQMETTFRTALWRQFGAAIAMLENALVACPAALWRELLWSVPPPPEFPPQFAEFWYVTFHALVWLDLYLSGLPEEEFAPPAPFAQGMLDSVETLPERPYTKEELRTYLVSLRQKCHTQLLTLKDVQAHQPVEYPWSEG
jgi:hypothetical protein